MLTPLLVEITSLLHSLHAIACRHSWYDILISNEEVTEEIRAFKARMQGYFLPIFYMVSEDWTLDIIPQCFPLCSQAYLYHT